MIEIRVENNTDEPFENMKFGILDADNTLLEEIDFKETDENTARFWVGYTNTTDFYLKIRTSERFIEETFDGSLPAFIAAFISQKKKRKKEADEIQKMINDYKEG